MRRLLVQPPRSRAADAALRVALLGPAVAIVAAAASRLGRLAPGPTLTVFAAGLGLAVLSLLFAVAAGAAIWRFGLRGAGSAAFAAAIAIATLAWPARLAAYALTHPALRDVSTDMRSPPTFSPSASVAAARGTPAPDKPDAASLAAEGALARPPEPLELDVTAEQAFRLASASANRQGWAIVVDKPPGPRIGSGRIEAVARTPALAFPLDVALRVTPAGGRSRIDMRVVARAPLHDFGATLSLLRSTMADIDAAANGR
ncbi:MAG: DUF1499 domain-containing protein [Hyphomicrobiales bacterium]|nr:DUF1499 domain-containing protein [Hyphomicrobiales bacterium]